MKKETKKDKQIRIYAKYGIEFDGEYIVSPLGKIRPLMPIGSNTKVGNAATFSIYHGDEILHFDDFKKDGKTQEFMKRAGITEIKASCPFHCKDCYCDNGNYRYDSTKSALMLRLILVKLHLDFVKRALIAQIGADDIKQIRIHAARDFFSNEYVDMWHDVAETCNDVVFWTYTKTEYALKRFENVKNLFIVPSVTPMGFNFGTCKELLYRYHKLVAMGYRVHICACGTDMEKHCSDCNTGCKAVGKECDFVLFIKHSTKDYKAGKTDPEDFSKIVELIRNQNN